MQSGCSQNSAKAEHSRIQAIQQHQQQAAGEERSLQIRNKKEKSALVANRGGVLALPKVKSANSSNTPKQKSQNRRSQCGKKQTKALNREELDDLGNKLEGKRPMC